MCSVTPLLRICHSWFLDSCEYKYNNKYCYSLLTSTRTHIVHSKIRCWFLYSILTFCFSFLLSNFFLFFCVCCLPFLYFVIKYLYLLMILLLMWLQLLVLCELLHVFFNFIVKQTEIKKRMQYLRCSTTDSWNIFVLYSSAVYSYNAPINC